MHLLELTLIHCFNHTTMLHLTSTQLRQAADLKEKIAALETELAFLMSTNHESGTPTSPPATALIEEQQETTPSIAAKPGKRKFSPAHIAKIRAAQKARWAKANATKEQPAAKLVKKGGMSAAGRARIAAAQKLRWAKVTTNKNAQAPAKSEGRPTRKMSAAGRAAISAAAKARWAKARAGKA
jgi:hypothetical protein